MQPAEGNFRFPKENRLKSSLKIRQVVLQRQYLTNFPVKCFFHRETSGNGNIKFAFLVSKKKFKRAVDRNRIKRLLREALRQNINRINCKKNEDLFLCFMFVDKNLPNYSSVKNAVEESLLQLQLLNNEDIINEKDSQYNR